VRAKSREAVLKPILQPYDTFGSSPYVDLNTTKWTYKTRADKGHVSHVVIDSGWEAKMAQTLEDMPDVVRYVKNQNLGFKIPYTLNGEEHSYIPDIVVVVRIPAGAERANGIRGNENAKSACADSELSLIIEVTGEKKKDKAEKVATPKTLWIPAVNNHGDLGRRAFM
jgi:type III restriction enzyme